MTTKPVASATPSVDAAVKKTAPAKFDQRFVAPILISCILLAAHAASGVLVAPEKTGLAIVSAILAEMVLGWIVLRKIPHLASAYVTGISVGILLRVEGVYWPYAFCSILSIMSKYVIRVNDRHIWNPSNFGIVITLLVMTLGVNALGGANSVHTLAAEFGNSHWSVLLVWVLGSVIVWRLRRFHICLTYAAAFVAFAWLRGLMPGNAFQTELGPITGPMYQLFIFFMITDPKTTVHGRRAQMLVAFLVALAECVIRVLGDLFAAQSPVIMELAFHAPYYSLFIVGPIANLIEIWRTPKKETPAPVPAAA